MKLPLAQVACPHFFNNLFFNRLNISLSTILQAGFFACMSIPAHAAGIFSTSLAASRVINAVFVASLYCLFIGWIIWRHKKRATNDTSQKIRLKNSVKSPDESTILIAYATQTGNAEQIARKTAESLIATGVSIEMHVLSAVGDAMLSRFTRVLFVVSTTGEGDAPDNAREFLYATAQNKQLAHLHYGILALGDASYTHFCGFGHTLDAWLQHQQATPLFDLIEVDRNDDGALRHWQYQLGVLAQNTEMADWKTPDYQQWTLTSRTLLNKGSVGAPVFLLRFAASPENMQWQAGDIAEIGPRNSAQSITHFLNRLKLFSGHQSDIIGDTLIKALADKLLPHEEIDFRPLHHLDETILLATLKTLPHREYSIASIPQNGAIELLIRQTQYADGRLGIGSGWLTQYAKIGGDIAMRIRKNSTFNAPVTDVPLILIGNGTGIAGLRAHLKARITAEQYDNWLIFGERNAQYDFYFKDELQDWASRGLLSKLQTAFSRDTAEKMYVQHVVNSSAPDIKNWVDNGAAIYVCGSANGMAPAVHAELLEILGESTLSALTAAGRYRRDVY